MRRLTNSRQGVCCKVSGEPCTSSVLKMSCRRVQRSRSEVFGLASGAALIGVSMPMGMLEAATLLIIRMVRDLELKQQRLSG